MKPNREAVARAALVRISSGDVAARGAELAPLPGGTHERSWLVTYDDGRRHALRLSTPASSALLDVATEARAMSVAASAGLAPAVVAVDEENGVLLTEYRPGVAWQASDARRAANIARLADVLRALHALRADLPVFAAELVAKRYLAALGAGSAVAPVSRATQWGDELLGLARRYDLRYAPTAFCHNDLVAANVLDDGELALVDFEYAVRGTPLLDLASLAAMNGFGGIEQRALLEAYRRVAPRETELEELGELVRMVRLFAWFWASLGAARTADPAPYAQYLAELTDHLQ
jgi:thiamine kinase-like enzyme